jgi:hypothetical protein
MKRDPKGQLEDFFRDELRLSVAEAPSFDDLAAYVEGRLDPEERAHLEERLAGDPALRQEVDELAALHAQMARPRRLAVRPLPVRMALLAAAAAVAAVAVARWHRPAEPTPSPGAGVVTPSPASVATLKDGDLRLGVSADGKVSGVSSLDPGMRDAVTAALRGVLPAPAGLAALQPAGSKVLGTETPAAFAPLSPRGTRVRAERPTFRWTSHPAARTYEVAVFDRDLQKQVASGPVAGTEWTSTKALPRGRTYLWQVTALAGGERVTAPAPPAPEARFEVAGPPLLAEVDARRAQAPTSHLVAALAFVEAGLLDDAEAELGALGADNPGSPEVGRLRNALSTLRPPSPQDPR